MTRNVLTHAQIHAVHERLIALGSKDARDLPIAYMANALTHLLGFSVTESNVATALNVVFPLDPRGDSAADADARLSRLEARVAALEGGRFV